MALESIRVRVQVSARTQQKQLELLVAMLMRFVVADTVTASVPIVVPLLSLVVSIVGRDAASYPPTSAAILRYCCAEPRDSANEPPLGSVDCWRDCGCAPRA